MYWQWHKDKRLRMIITVIALHIGFRHTVCRMWMFGQDRWNINGFQRRIYMIANSTVPSLQNYRYRRDFELCVSTVAMKNCASSICFLLVYLMVSSTSIIGSCFLMLLIASFDIFSYGWLSILKLFERRYYLHTFSFNLCFFSVGSSHLLKGEIP